MRAVLGEPDHIFPRATDGYQLEQAKLYNIKQPKNQYTYQSGWQTLTLFIFEQDDGSVTSTYSGKSKSIHELDDG